MRDYKTVAQRVLQRRDAYLLAQKRKRQMFLKYAAVPACLFLMIGAGVRIWQQTSSGREILEQTKVEMTDVSGNTENSENLKNYGNSENQDFIESSKFSEAPESRQTSETGRGTVTETRQHIVTDVLELDVPGTQDTQPEQTATAPAEPADPEHPGSLFTDSVAWTPTEPADSTQAIPTEATVTLPAPATDLPPWTQKPLVDVNTRPTDPPEPPAEPEPPPPNDDVPSTEPTAPTPPSWEPTMPDETTGEGNDPPPVAYPMTTATTTTATTSTTARKPTNYTVSIEEFTPTQEQLASVRQETVLLNFREHYNSFQKLLEYSGATVRCKVLSVAYAILENLPYTVYDVEITESVSGDFIQGDKLSIVQYGGYFISDSSGSNSDPSDSIDPDNSNEVRPPSEQEAPELIQQQVAYSETPVVAQEYVLFLNPALILNGAYQTLNQNEGMFVYDPKTGTLSRTTKQDVPINSSTYKELLEISENSESEEN